MNEKQDFEEKSKESAKVFADIMPALEHYFGGKLRSTEGHDNDGSLEDFLDHECGIDAIVKTDTNEVFGIAHRVKTNDYTDFTIRTHNKKGRYTEIDHMRQSGFKPRYHVQTVCIDGKPTIVAIARSMDLLYAIDILGIARPHNAYDGNHFVSLDWNDLINNGINVDFIKL